jgi:hypothetical protein
LSALLIALGAAAALFGGKVGVIPVILAGAATGIGVAVSRGPL